MSHRHFSRNNEACIVTADVKIEARENREPEPSGHRRRGDSDISPAKSWPRLMPKEISGDPKLYAESFEHARGVSARLRQPVRAGGPRAV